MAALERHEREARVRAENRMGVKEVVKNTRSQNGMPDACMLVMHEGTCYEGACYEGTCCSVVVGVEDLSSS